jgi:hypothetical protein
MAVMTWRALEEELGRWRDAGLTADFWWRDDDASTRSSALERLLRLSSAAAVPLALAVVPLSAQAELFAGLRASVLMHGTDHRNRAGPGEKKTEFPAAEAEDEASARLAAARVRLEALAGERFLRVLAPPWNRLKPSLVARLPRAGLHGVSGYGARKAAEAARGVREVNTHVDIIDWHGTRGFAGEQAALRAALGHLSARRSKAIDALEPTGLLTHHALHDAAAWDFIERLFERTRALGARWAEPSVLFPSPR